MCWQVEALDLNVGGARYDADVRSDFKKFKQARRCLPCTSNDPLDHIPHMLKRRGTIPT